MKQIYYSLIIAFSMYSKLPMPNVPWSKENMKYVMCFFPFVGAAIGGVVCLWSIIADHLSISHVLYTAVIVLIPLLLTGGIHMDGFMDTTDALCSYQPMEKKLQILKDPNSGAFAVIACVGYYLLTYAVWYDATQTELLVLTIGFILSRAFSGLAVVTFPLAKNSGLAATFSNEAKKKVTGVVMIIFIILCAIAMLAVNPRLGLICLMAAALTYIYYYHMSSKKFGGITGDLAGYFLQLCELIMAVSVVIAGKV